MHYDFREIFLIGEIKMAKDSERETHTKPVVLRVWPRSDVIPWAFVRNTHQQAFRQHTEQTPERGHSKRPRWL